MRPRRRISRSPFEPQPADRAFPNSILHSIHNSQITTHNCPEVPLALTSTIYTLDIDLADADRGVYEHLDLRVARHPSESEEYLVTRILAYCLELTNGIAFSRGLSDPEEPTLSVRDLTGAIRSWIEIGSPDAARVHKAGKAAARVVVYTHRDPAQMLRQWAGERIHRLESLEIYHFDRALIDGLVARLDRRMTFALSVNDGTLYAAFEDGTVEGERKAVTGDL